MGNNYTFSKNGTFRKKQKPICEYASDEKFYSHLYGLMVRQCKCFESKSHPQCIENFKWKKIVCVNYLPKK